jgi:hypothetical protein
MRKLTLVRQETKPNFGSCGDRASEDRLELRKASFADSYSRLSALEYP